MKLVVVESPAKAKTIEKYLGPGHRVLASFGHVRDLPPKDGSVDPDDEFAMLWQVSPDRAKQLKAITDEAKGADTLILATDPDREGEAIAAHVAEQIRPKRGAAIVPVRRVLFHEITKDAVQNAIQNAGAIDDKKVEAQQARRVLDRLVGYKASPVLWKTVKKGISAGRSNNTYRGQVFAHRKAEGARNFTNCDSLLIGNQCGAHTVPYIEVRNPTATIEHEATTSKISEDQLFYAMSRGLDQEAAVALIVNGFAREVLKQLPMEFAVEAQKLLGISLEGSVG